MSLLLEIILHIYIELESITDQSLLEIILRVAVYPTSDSFGTAGGGGGLGQKRVDSSRGSTGSSVCVGISPSRL